MQRKDASAEQRPLARQVDEEGGRDRRKGEVRHWMTPGKRKGRRRKLKSVKC